MTGDQPRRLAEPFATSVRRGNPLLWATGSDADRTALLGWGERFRATARGPLRFARLAAAFEDFLVTLPTDKTAPPVRAFISATFAADSLSESILIVPALLGSWRDGTLTVTPNGSGPLAVSLPEPSEPYEFSELELVPGSLTRERFRRAVAAAVARIEAGEVEKVVLARDLEAITPDPIDIPAVLARLQEANPTSWTFHVDGLIGASPEMLIELRGPTVRSQALAGSAPVTGDPDVDDATAARLAASSKDHAEHAYAADSVIERLAEVADVRAAQTTVLRLPSIMHLATEISGTLREPRSALELAGLVHPSAAVCGTPTDVATRVIAELEGFDRGRYAGPVGWVDAAGDGQFVIALRCGQVNADATSVRLLAGGGIVAGSVPSDELAETARKFLPMYEALSPVARP